MERPSSSSTSEPTPAPPTWRERLRDWMHPPRQLTFTIAGKFFVLMTIGIGFAAINTGNNLLFLLLGMMLSLITASGLLSEAVIRRIDARRDLPSHIFADSPAPGAFTVHNPTRWPSLSLEICERNVRAELGPLEGRELGPRRIPWWKFWKLRTREDTEFGEPVARGWAMRIDAGERVDLKARYRLPERGRYALAGLDVVTRFPFGLFEKRRELDQPDHALVYPAPLPAKDWLSSVHSRFGDIPRNKRGPGQEYFGLREYRPGEDQRLIHWKSSARRGEVVVRETEGQQQRAVEISLLNCTGQPARRRHLVDQQFESGLRRVVGLIRSLTAQGWRVGLRTLDERVDAGESSNHVEHMLAVVAQVELHDGHHSIAPSEAPDGPVTASAADIVVGLDAPLSAVGDSFDLKLSFAHFDDIPTRVAEAA